MTRVLPYTLALVAPTPLDDVSGFKNAQSGLDAFVMAPQGALDSYAPQGSRLTTSALPSVRFAEPLPTDSPLVGRGGIPDPVYLNFNELKKDLANFIAKNGKGKFVVLLRHPISLYNRVSDLFNGDNDSPPIAEGYEQLKELIATLKDFPVDEILSSPLERALDPAFILRRELGVTEPVKDIKDLEEMERGVLSGRPKKLNSLQIDELFAKFSDPVYQRAFQDKYRVTEAEMNLVFAIARERRAVLQMRAQAASMSEDDYVQWVTEIENTLDGVPPDGDSFRQDEERKRLLIELLFNGLKSGTHLVVSHGMTNRFLMLKMFKIPVTSLDQLFEIGQGYGAINVLWQAEGSEDWRLLVFNSDRGGN